MVGVYLDYRQAIRLTHPNPTPFHCKPWISIKVRNATGDLKGKFHLDSTSLEETSGSHWPMRNSVGSQGLSPPAPGTPATSNPCSAPVQSSLPALFN